MKLTAIVTSVAEPEIIADLEAWLDDLSNFGLPASTETLDGGQLYPAGHPELSLIDHFPDNRPTLTDVATWITDLYAAGLDPVTPLVDAGDLAVYLTIDSVSTIECGNCELLDVLVDIHPHDQT